MEKNLYIDASHPNETRIVLKSDNFIEEYEFEDKNNLNFKNNIYLGTSRVEPSLQAAFVNFGRERHGFLAFNDIQSDDYYQLPSEDKEKIRVAEEKKLGKSLKKTLEIPQESSSPESINNVNDNVEENNSNIKNGEIKKDNYRDEIKSSLGIKKYKIQEVIKPGQVILIQVIKEERGQKEQL